MTPNPTITSRIAIGLLVAAAGAITGFLLIAYAMFGGRGRMTSAESPDGQYRITLDERACGLDRNFRLWLWIKDQDTEIQLDWPGFDTSPVVKREHFVWSPDSKVVALVGDSYSVGPDATLPNGDQICLVYDVGNNAFYFNGYADLPSYSADVAVEVFGEATLQAAPPIE